MRVWPTTPGFPKYEGWPEDQRIGGTEFDDALCRSGNVR